MTNEDKARAIIGGDCKRENCLECGGKYSADEGGCISYQRIMQMAEWKDNYYYKVITEIVCAAYNSCEDHSKINEVLKKYKL